MKNLLINILFRLLGNSTAHLHKIQYLFGVSTMNHEARKRRWEKALARAWRDKDFLDFLYYQAESDKEKAWRGKISKELSQGARIRTLFIVYQARKAYENSIKSKQTTASTRGEVDSELKNIDRAYKSIVDV